MTRYSSMEELSVALIELEANGLHQLRNVEMNGTQAAKSRRNNLIMFLLMLITRAQETGLMKMEMIMKNWQ